VLLVLFSAAIASAHQPFFEDRDFTAAAPGSVKDPTVSTALYATLQSPEDVDYVTFEGKQGQSILIGITIPAIAGQEDFAPAVAIIGPGLPAAKLPAQVAVPQGEGGQTGAMVWAAPEGTPPVFFEPFSRTSYWERQEDRVTLPADGRYTLAVWSDRGASGRYTLVVGDREVFGGDPAFGMKLPAYWTAVPAAPAAAPKQGEAEAVKADDAKADGAKADGAEAGDATAGDAKAGDAPVGNDDATKGYRGCGRP
jgi:hypothetical protein